MQQDSRDDRDGGAGSRADSRGAAGDAPRDRVPAEIDRTPSEAGDADEQRTIREATDAIRTLARSALLGFVNEVGRILFESVYLGDREAFHSRRRGRATLREIARRLDGLDLSAVSLYRSIATHLLLERHAELRELKGLTPTHVREVLPLPEEEQAPLLVEAHGAGWTTRELESEVRRRLGKARLPGPAPTPLLRSIRGFGRLARQTEERLAGSALGVDELLQVQTDLMAARAEPCGRRRGRSLPRGARVSRSAIIVVVDRNLAGGSALRGAGVGDGSADRSRGRACRLDPRAARFPALRARAARRMACPADDRLLLGTRSVAAAEAEPALAAQLECSLQYPARRRGARPRPDGAAGGAALQQPRCHWSEHFRVLRSPFVQG